MSISSQSGHRMPLWSAEGDAQLATTPTEELGAELGVEAGEY